MKTTVSKEVSPKYDLIKIATDWHAGQYRVSRIIDNGRPEPPQKFTPEGFLVWVKKQQSLAKEVVTCYEAGAGGYVLHRQLTALGVNNIVVTPRKLDPHCRRVINDKTDAINLALNLDSWIRGNDKALRKVEVPTREVEQARCITRQRKQLQKCRLQLASQGRTLLLAQGWRESNSWWKDKRMAHLQRILPPWLYAMLETHRAPILVLEEKIQELEKQIRQAAPKNRPKGLGALTYEEIVREVGDFRRFKNRKAPGSYVGLTGGVESSGDTEMDLSITKAGNKRLRTSLVEAAWRFAYYQPESRTMSKWAPILRNPKAGKRARKRAVVAAARQLFVDIWRWKTGKATVQQLRWKMSEEEEQFAA